MLEQAKDAIQAAKEQLLTPRGGEASKSNSLKWIGWGVIGLGFAALFIFVASMFLPKGGGAQEIGQSNPLDVPTSRLFGFWEDKKHTHIDYWVARISQVEGNRFRIKWNGGIQKDGAGAGIGMGVGVIMPNGGVRIELAEELQSDPNRQPLIALPGMSTGPKQQSLVLEGRYYQVAGGRSYFQGDYMERGAKFYPFTRWVLETDLPKGWTLPTGS